MGIRDAVSERFSKKPSAGSIQSAGGANRQPSTPLVTAAARAGGNQAGETGPPKQLRRYTNGVEKGVGSPRTAETAADARALLMILPQVHLRKPCYDFYFL